MLNHNIIVQSLCWSVLSLLLYCVEDYLLSYRLIMFMLSEEIRVVLRKCKAFYNSQHVCSLVPDWIYAYKKKILWFTYIILQLTFLQFLHCFKTFSIKPLFFLGGCVFFLIEVLLRGKIVLKVALAEERCSSTSAKLLNKQYTSPFRFTSHELS